MGPCSSYPVSPTDEKAKERLAAEEGWLKLGHDLGFQHKYFDLEVSMALAEGCTYFN